MANEFTLWSKFHKSETGINTSQMNLTLNFADNNLTRFESTVFKNLLRNMAKWNNTGLIDVSHSKGIAFIGLRYRNFTKLP